MPTIEALFYSHDPAAVVVRLRKYAYCGFKCVKMYVTVQDFGHSIKTLHVH